VDSFDADVLVYAAVHGHPLRRRILQIFREAPGDFAGAGSVLLLPEVLAKPLRDGQADGVRSLAALLSRLDLRPVDETTAEIATVLGAKYGMRAAHATHLATAVGLGAGRFITNNRRDFPRSIDEVQVTYPEDLPEADR
jgi:predicted nucleic acid-binding protein